MVKITKSIKSFRVGIVGAGAAGIGMGVTLKDFGIDDFIILEKNIVGSSFLKWTSETRFLTPSFQSTQFGLLDLNATAINTSPAFSSGKEHLNGPEYVRYLNRVVYEFQLPIHEDREVLRVSKRPNDFVVETTDTIYIFEFLIWATGEFQFPNDKPFPGSEYCIHTSKINTYKNLLGNDFIIIGGYESGVDAALNLAILGKEVTILEKGGVLDSPSQDPSLTLSFYTKQRLEETEAADQIRLVENIEVLNVKKDTVGNFIVKTNNGSYQTPTAPILATGYQGGESMLKEMFFLNEGYCQLNEFDESIKINKLFLVGPHVKHSGVIFCFIYKFRQRFGVIAKRIAAHIGLNTKEAESFYRKNNMFLDDLSCCQNDCKC